MINILKNCGLLLCGIIPQGLQDFIGMVLDLAWEFIKFLTSFVASLVLTCLLIWLVLGFVYSIFAAPLVAIAICAVVVAWRVVTR